MAKKKTMFIFTQYFQLFSITWVFRIQSVTLSEIKICSVIILNGIHERLE